ncbi:MAG: MFS transporter [Pseudomonadota bacterium]
MPVARVPSTVSPARDAAAHASGLRSIVIGLMGFLTLVDLFAAQAILPSLVEKYAVSPAAMGLAVNASTLGMAVSCLAVGLVSSRLDRRAGIWMSLVALAVPTALLAVAPGLGVFTALRLAQGVLMASAFTLTMAYLAEHSSGEGTARALAAYVTGVVASNLVGRMVSATVADSLGLEANFVLFAGLNLAGALLVVRNLDAMATMAVDEARQASVIGEWRRHLCDRALRAAFAIGFLILFAFIGVFTYVNIVLVQNPIGLSQMSLGIVYLVFLPSMLTTPLAGAITLHLGPARTTALGLSIAGLGLPLLLLVRLDAILAGMALVAIGTFFAQAVATGFVGRRATGDRAAASGLYLASYYLGGLTGAWLLGRMLEQRGWPAVVVGVAVALALAGLASLRLALPPSGPRE